MDADREYRQSIQRRFAELTTARRTKQSELNRINADAPPAAGETHREQSRQGAPV